MSANQEDSPAAPRPGGGDAGSPPRPGGRVRVAVAVTYVAVLGILLASFPARNGDLWGHLAAGRDAMIEAHFHGDKAGAALRNVNGSFYDFTAERNIGTQRTLLAAPPDAWGGRAVVDWARHLAGGCGYSNSIEAALQVASVIDRIYGR